MSKVNGRPARNASGKQAVKLQRVQRALRQLRERGIRECDLVEWRGMRPTEGFTIRDELLEAVNAIAALTGETPFQVFSRWLWGGLFHLLGGEIAAGRLSPGTGLKLVT